MIWLSTNLAIRAEMEKDGQLNSEHGCHTAAVNSQHHNTCFFFHKGPWLFCSVQWNILSYSSRSPWNHMREKFHENSCFCCYNSLQSNTSGCVKRRYGADKTHQIWAVMNRPQVFIPFFDYMPLQQQQQHQTNQPSLHTHRTMREDREREEERGGVHYATNADLFHSWRRQTIFSFQRFPVLVSSFHVAARCSRWQWPDTRR